MASGGLRLLQCIKSHIQMGVRGFKGTATFCSVHSQVNYSWSGHSCCLILQFEHLIEMGNKWNDHISLHNKVLSPYSCQCWEWLWCNTACSKTKTHVTVQKSGGTIIGQGGIPKAAPCWLGRRPSSDIYAECRGQRRDTWEAEWGRAS